MWILSNIIATKLRKFVGEMLLEDGCTLFYATMSARKYANVDPEQYYCDKIEEICW